MFHLIKTNNLCSKFHIICSLLIFRIIIQIVKYDPKLKSVATLFMLIAQKHKIQLSIDFLVHFLTIVAYLSVLNASAH
jgi:hypothetical protein